MANRSLVGKDAQKSTLADADSVYTSMLNSVVPVQQVAAVTAQVAPVQAQAVQQVGQYVFNCISVAFVLSAFSAFQGDQAFR